MTIPEELIERALERAWTDFLDANPDDVNSPEEYPDHALVTFKQMVAMVKTALADSALLQQIERRDEALLAFADIVDQLADKVRPPSGAAAQLHFAAIQVRAALNGETDSGSD